MLVIFTEYIASKGGMNCNMHWSDENAPVAMATYYNYLAKVLLLTFFGCLATESCCPDMNSW